MPQSNFLSDLTPEIKTKRWELCSIKTYKYLPSYLKFRKFNHNFIVSIFCDNSAVANLVLVNVILNRVRGVN